MRIAVLVTTFGRPDYLARCVDSLLSQRRPPDEVVLVTRAGDAPTERWVSDLLGAHRGAVTLRHARVEEPGVLAANRAGWPLATGDIVCFIDDDAAARSDWLERIEARFVADPALGAVGGRDVIHTKDGIVERPASRVGEVTWYGRIIGNHDKVTTGARRVDQLKGVNMSYRRALVPGFDERILGNAHYYEMDLCFGVRAQGYDILYDSAIVVDHYQTAPRYLPGSAVAADPQREFFVHHNMVYVMLKHLGLTRRLVFLAYTFARDAAAGAVKIAVSRRGATAPQAAALLGAAMRGKVAGLRSWLDGKRASRRAPARRTSGGAQRILYLCPTSAVGGAERCLLEMLRELPRDRYEAHLLAPRPGPLVEAAAAAGATARVVPWPAAALKAGRERSLLNRLLAPAVPVLLLPASARIARYARANAIDLIHTNGTKAHIVGSMAALLSGVPVIWHLRDVLAAGPLRLVLRTLGRLSPRRIIANSRATAASMDPAGRHPRVILIHDGISLEEFAPRTPPPGLRASLGLAPEHFVIGTVGALAPLKGHIHLVRAMAGVLAAAPEARLLIVGAEMYETIGHRGHRADLERESARLGLAGKVIFAGHREDAATLYSIMDIVALCSVRPESFGRVLVEGMACERPVISTGLGGPEEILEGTDAGLVVPSADPGALSEAVLRLHADPARRARMGAAGRRRVAERFSLERTTSMIRTLYAELLETPESPARTSPKEAAR